MQYQDDTHFDIALAAIEAGMHVLITKPTVKSLENHLKLIEAARKSNVHVCCCSADGSNLLASCWALSFSGAN